MEAHHIKVIRIINVLLFGVFVCSLILPWIISIWDFGSPGVLVIGGYTYFTAYVGVICLLISFILSLTVKLKPSFVFGVIALIFLFPPIPIALIPMIIFSYLIIIDFGPILYIISWTGFIITISLIRSYDKKFRSLLINKKTQEIDTKIKEYVKKLPSIYDQISFIDIINTLGLRNRDLPKLRLIVEDLIYKNEISGKIVSDFILFKKDSELDLYGIPTESSHSQGLTSPPFTMSPPSPYAQIPSPTQYPSTTSYTPQTSYYHSKYMAMGITFIIIGIILLSIGLISWFLVYIPIFSQFYIGEILGIALISIGIGYIRKSK